MRGPALYAVGDLLTVPGQNGLLAKHRRYPSPDLSNPSLDSNDMPLIRRPQIAGLLLLCPMLEIPAVRVRISDG